MEVKLLENFKPLLKECFSTDDNLINLYHIKATKGLEACVTDTYDLLKDCNVKIYALRNDKENIGYFGVEGGNFLTGFFIKPSYRNKENIVEFWKIVDSYMPSVYYSGVYKKNIPAVKFLSRRGTIKLEFENKGYYFEINKEFLCQ